MDETDDNMSADDLSMVDSPSLVKVKPKKRSLVERELETSLTARVTSPVTNGDTSSTSRYGRARRVKTEPDSNSDSEKVMKQLKSPGQDQTPVKVQSPVYKMHASNSPVKTEPKETPKKVIDADSSLDNQIENIYNENISLSRFGSDEKKKPSPGTKFPKVYIRKDLIQKREKEETVVLIKNMFSPVQSPYKSTNSHLNNILERSSEKYLNTSSKPHNGYLNTSSVVKTLDFDSNKKKKKENRDSTGLAKSDLFEMEAKCEYQVGDLAWARMGTYPFWPCIVTREPSSGMFVKKKLFGRIERDVIHVTFFGDNGRRGWIVDTMLRKFLGQLEFEATRERFSPAAKKRDPRLYAAYFISEKKMPQWSISVEEAETLLREPKRLRIDILNDMLSKSRVTKSASKVQKGGKITRTASDVSLSESLYDTLFSEDDGKAEDTERSKSKTRKSLDVSEVVTACLDNMAAKTGITKIQRQSHMDRWLQKAKSKTPEKLQPKATPQKKEKEVKVVSSKKKKVSPIVPRQKPYSFRKSVCESRNLKSHHNEHDYSTQKSVTNDTEAVLSFGVGATAKVESPTEKDNVEDIKEEQPTSKGCTEIDNSINNEKDKVINTEPVIVSADDTVDEIQENICSVEENAELERCLLSSKTENIKDCGQIIDGTESDCKKEESMVVDSAEVNEGMDIDACQNKTADLNGPTELVIKEDKSEAVILENNIASGGVETPKTPKDSINKSIDRVTNLEQEYVGPDSNSKFETPLNKRSGSRRSQRKSKNTAIDLNKQKESRLDSEKSTDTAQVPTTDESVINYDQNKSITSPTLDFIKPINDVPVVEDKISNLEKPVLRKSKRHSKNTEITDEIIDTPIKTVSKRNKSLKKSSEKKTKEAEFLPKESEVVGEHDASVSSAHDISMNDVINFDVSHQNDQSLVENSTLEGNSTAVNEEPIPSTTNADSEGQSNSIETPLQVPTVTIETETNSSPETHLEDKNDRIEAEKQIDSVKDQDFMKEKEQSILETTVVDKNNTKDDETEYGHLDFTQNVSSLITDEQLNKKDPESTQTKNVSANDTHMVSELKEYDHLDFIFSSLNEKPNEKITTNSNNISESHNGISNSTPFTENNEKHEGIDESHSSKNIEADNLSSTQSNNAVNVIELSDSAKRELRVSVEKLPLYPTSNLLSNCKENLNEENSKHRTNNIVDNNVSDMSVDEDLDERLVFQEDSFENIKSTGSEENLTNGTDKDINGHSNPIAEELKDNSVCNSSTASKPHNGLGNKLIEDIVDQTKKLDVPLKPTSIETSLTENGVGISHFTNEINEHKTMLKDTMTVVTEKNNDQNNDDLGKTDLTSIHLPETDLVTNNKSKNDEDRTDSKVTDKTDLSSNGKTDMLTNDKVTDTSEKHSIDIDTFVTSVNRLPEPIKLNGFHVDEVDFSDGDFNLETSSINSEDSEPLSLTKTKLLKKNHNKAKKALEDAEFVKYLEMRQDEIMDEHPELSHDEIILYLHKTWEYEENAKPDLVKNDDIEQSGLVKGLNEHLKPKRSRSNVRDSKKRNKVRDEDSISISSDISDTSVKRRLRTRMAKSPATSIEDNEIIVNKEISLDIKTELLDNISINSDVSCNSSKYIPFQNDITDTVLPEIRENNTSPIANNTDSKNDSIEKIKEKSDDVKHKKKEKAKSPKSKENTLKNYFKSRTSAADTKSNQNDEETPLDISKEIKEEFDPETASINSEDSEVSQTKRKQRKPDKNKTMDDPEFLKYVEMRQDSLLDENPQLSQEEVTSYLFKTWLYEENLKPDHKKTDDLEQAALVKGLDPAPSTPHRKRIKKKVKVEKDSADEELPPKEKPKRKISQPYYNEYLSDIEDEIELFEIFKPKKKLNLMTTPDGKTIKKEEVLDDDVIEIDEVDEVEVYFSQLSEPKPNVFKGMVREKVCEICEKTGNLVKCKGCNSMFHSACVLKAKEVVEVPEPPSRGRKKKIKKIVKSKNLEDSGSDEKSQNVSAELNISMEEELESRTVNADDFEAALAAKMQELEPVCQVNYDSYSSDDGLDWNSAPPGKCEIIDIKLKKRTVTDYANFKCNKCEKHSTPVCFVCKEAVSKTGVKHRQKCQTAHCHKYYHLECLDHWPQTQFLSGEPSKSNKKINEHFEAVMCPRHVCHTCVSDDPRGCKTRFSGDKLARCVRCPATYHSFTKCLPAGSQILTGSLIVCPRHYEHRPGKVPCHVNTGWCFICALGGSLICCEYCPTSFHAECLNIKPPEGGYMCEDCETGRLPLYGEMVWVKLGHYRWWPGIVLHPSEIPENIMAVKHSPGEFVVRFFGQYDHYWVNRGRVFPFQEGDSGKISSQKSKIDADFTTAMEHAQRACEILKTATPNEDELSEISASLLPPHYVKLKVNKPCGSLCGRRVDAEESSLTQCECDPTQEEPCGPYSHCLNRMLLTECGPLCRAGERCLNRAFERRRYPRLAPHRAKHRGWGLRTLDDIKAGQFVIEYVGELIDEEEFRRRMNRKHEIRDENFYFLTLDKERMIDAGPKGNLARFMNHCCEPNCETQKWTVLGDVRVGLFALQDIPANSELTFNYNLECAGIEKKRCLCGARRCSGYIGAKPKQDDTQPKKSKIPAKRTYKKRKNVEDSPSTSKPKPKRPVGRPAKPRELTDIEKDLLIIRNATNGLSSDSEGSRLGSVDDNAKALKRKRVSFDEESSKKQRLDGVEK